MSRAEKTIQIDSDKGEPVNITVAYEKPAGVGEPRWVSRGYTAAINPETGEQAVWGNGETVPEWAVPAELLEQTKTPTERATP